VKRLCFVVASELTATAFLLDQLGALSQRYRVCLVVNTADPQFLERRGVDVEVVPLPLQRRLSPVQDARHLLGLWSILRSGQFDVVHSVTPKAGLLAMSAGVAARVPVRLHTFTGQVWATRRGLWRGALKSADRALARMATLVLADSVSQREFLIRERVVRADRIAVLGAGSISGVDLDRFRPDPSARSGIRAAMGVPARATLFLFVGRLTRDKGLLDLARAFSEHARHNPLSRLLVVGPDEEGILQGMRTLCRDCNDRVAFEGFAGDPERLMAAADVLCLPSYREGFGSVLIEAAATGVPSIASRIYGITDAVQDGITGILHEPRDAPAIATAMTILADDPELRQSLGRAARARARAEFSQARLTAEVVALYARLLANPAAPIP
jgi:glycosyltransferase involved in cell wall biosynthesis